MTMVLWASLYTDIIAAADIPKEKAVEPIKGDHHCQGQG